MSSREEYEYDAWYSDMLDEREQRIDLMDTDEMCACMRELGYTDEEIEDMFLDDIRRELVARL